MENRRIFITGGAGFIGSNLANYFLGQGFPVSIYDNLSRKGVVHNLNWLRQNHGDRLAFIDGDIRDFAALEKAVAGAQVIYHTAGQTAVTTSVVNPREDFEINAQGTLNLLEAARQSGDDPAMIFTSTNKVYGGMEDLRIAEEELRYVYQDHPEGIDENRALDFHSPYGCSKGAADQYVRDYARIYGMKTIVFRMSSIYGPRQFGMEDQAWVAYFVIALMKGWPLTIYGDGKQVRDILFIDDLVRAFELATEHIHVTAGQIYNIGGGPNKTISVWSEFSGCLEDLLGHPVKAASFRDWRPGDQKIYISDIRRAERDFGWSPSISVNAGLRLITDWVIANKDIF